MLRSTSTRSSGWTLAEKAAMGAPTSANAGASPNRRANWALPTTWSRLTDHSHQPIEPPSSTRSSRTSRAFARARSAAWSTASARRASTSRPRETRADTSSASALSMTAWSEGNPPGRATPSMTHRAPMGAPSPARNTAPA